MAAAAPDGLKLAVVCTPAGQPSRLEIAQFDGKALGPPATVATGLVAGPAWAPDGSGLLYLKALDTTGHFQLFYQNLSGTSQTPTPTPSPVRAPARGGTTATPAPVPTPQPARQVTTNNDYDATSAPLWTA